jgi:hypothetical protein
MRCGRALALLFLLIGVVGLIFSVFPQLYPSIGCPRSVVGARVWLMGFMRGLSGESAARPPFAPTLARAGDCLPAGAFPSPSAPLGVEPGSGLPIWGAAELANFGSCAPGATVKDLPGCRVLLGVAGFVYDVTEKGAVHYAPGAGYCLFAGRDATRSLALGSLSSDDLEKGGWVEGVDEASVKEQATFYREKYGPPIGALPPPTPPPPPPPGTEREAL